MNKQEITEQEMIEAALEVHIANGGDPDTIFEINSHEEFGREYVEAIPENGNSGADTPRWFLDSYEIVS